MAEETVAVASDPTSKSGPFPAELNGWNWGAFFMGWIWALGMSNVIGFLLCFFLSGIGNIIVGIKGNEWAWKTRQFASVEEFKAVQHAWAIWGAVVFIASFVIVFGLILFTVILAGTATFDVTTY